MTLPSYNNTVYQTGVALRFSDGSMLVQQPDGRYVFEPLTDHVAAQNDDFISLAYQYYGELTNNPREYWALIAAANPHVEDPTDLPLGETIVIPAFQPWPIRRM